MDKLQWFKFCPTDWLWVRYNVALMTHKVDMRLVCCIGIKNVAYQLKMLIEIDTEHLEILIKKRK
jgi:hypothetical protein